MTIERTSEQEPIVLESARNDGKNPGEVLTEPAVWLHELAADEDERRLLDRRFAIACDGMGAGFGHYARPVESACSWAW